jgi:hypothetical protein
MDANDPKEATAVNLHDAVLGVIPTYGNSALDITLAAVIAVMLLVALAWMIGGSWMSTHHRPH